MLKKVLALALIAQNVFADEDDMPPPPPPPPMEEEEPVVEQQAPPPPPPPVRELEPEPVREPVNVNVAASSSSEAHLPHDAPSSIRPGEEHDVYINRKRKLLVEEHPKVVAGKHTWEVGAWLYGAYKDHLEGIHTAHECADGCEADSGCFHWVFELDVHTCHYRGNSGGLNNDLRHYVTGHSRRYLAHKAGEASGTKAKEL